MSIVVNVGAIVDMIFAHAVIVSFIVVHIHAASPLSEVTVTEGGTARLPCHVGFTGNYRLEWRDTKRRLLTRNKKLVTSDSRIQIRQHHTEWTLVVSEVRRKDQGVYQCVIRTSSKIVRKIRLLVSYPPQLQKVNATDITALVGRNLTLRCLADGNPSPAITWYHTVHDGPRSTVHHGNTLTLLDLQERHGGRYECVADNTIAPAARHESILRILNCPCEQIGQQVDAIGPPAPPTIHVTAPQPAYIGRAVTLQCEIKWSPAGEVTWGNATRGATRLWKLPSGSYLLSLYIARLDVSHFRYYTCQAKNTEGSNSATTRLYDPREDEQPFVSSYTGLTSTSASIKCPIKGLIMSDELKWTYTQWTSPDDVIVKIGSKSSQAGYTEVDSSISQNRAITFSHLETKHAGTYTCKLNDQIQGRIEVTVVENIKCPRNKQNLVCELTYRGVTPNVSLDWYHANHTYGSQHIDKPGRIVRVMPKSNLAGKYSCKTASIHGEELFCEVTSSGSVWPNYASHENGGRHVDMFTFYISVAVTAGTLLMLFGSALCAVTLRYRKIIRLYQQAASSGQDIVVLNYKRGQKRNKQSNSTSLNRQESTSERRALTNDRQVDM